MQESFGNILIATQDEFNRRFTLDDSADPSSRDADEQFDLDFILMAGELDKMFKDLLAAMSGEEDRLDPAK